MRWGPFFPKVEKDRNTRLCVSPLQQNGLAPTDTRRFLQHFPGTHCELPPDSTVPTSNVVHLSISHQFFIIPETTLRGRFFFPFITSGRRSSVLRCGHYSLWGEPLVRGESNPFLSELRFPVVFARDYQRICGLISLLRSKGSPAPWTFRKGECLTSSLPPPGLFRDPPSFAVRRLFFLLSEDRFRIIWPSFSQAAWRKAGPR